MFVVVPGASMHMLSKGDLSSDVQMNEEAQVFVHDLDLFITVQLREETPAVLSLHMLAQNMDIHRSGKKVKLHD